MKRELLTSHWTDEELSELKRLLFKGYSAGRIGLRLRRSPRAVERMLRTSGLPTPTQIRKQLEQQRLAH